LKYISASKKAQVMYFHFRVKTIKTKSKRRGIWAFRLDSTKKLK
jgi:hypothetical protein